MWFFISVLMWVLFLTKKDLGVGGAGVCVALGTCGHQLLFDLARAGLRQVVGCTLAGPRNKIAPKRENN